MDAEKVERYMKLTTQSGKDQQELNRESLETQMDASDRIIMRKAAEAAMELAKTADPQ